jgi:hypothetical protein
MADEASAHRFMPVQIGTATVFVEEARAPVEIDQGDEIYPVALPSPKEAFEQAGELLQEVVRIFDKRIQALVKRPEEVCIEFSLGFTVTGRAHLIPVLLSAETSAQAAIKVSAKWGSATSPS